MQKFRKTLCAFLSVVMLISVFSIAVNAGVDPIDSTASQNIGIKLEVEHADGTEATTVTPGETVTVNVYVTAKEDDARIAGGMLFIFWDSNIYTYVEGSRTWGLSSIDPLALYEINNTSTPYTNTVSNFTEEEKAYGWNIAGNFQVSNSAGTNNTNATLIKENDANPFMSIQLKVSDSVLPGTSAPIGIPTTAIAPKNTTRMNYTYIQTWTDQSATVVHNKAKSYYVMDAIRDDITVASDEPVVTGPVVTKTQAEVKMTLNEDKTAVDYAAAPFQFRVISSISEDDWNTYFNGDGSNIESVGFVAYKGDGAFDMETAKSVAMGGSAADYQAAKTDYIQKVDGQPANFGARIDFTARENVKDVTYIAFVQYDTDQYAFYDTSYSVALNQNYDSIVSQYAGFIAG